MTGRVFIADTNNQVVRMINTDVTITIIAGISGSLGYSGDNGPAISANLNFPRGVFVNQIGTVFIADNNYQRIREVTYGKSSTVAGTGSRGYTGDGGPATNAQVSGPFGVSVDQTGRVFIADTLNNAVRIIFVWWNYINYSWYWVTCLQQRQWASCQCSVGIPGRSFC
jgi:hypothetical protein